MHLSVNVSQSEVEKKKRFCGRPIMNIIFLIINGIHFGLVKKIWDIFAIAKNIFISIP